LNLTPEELFNGFEPRIEAVCIALRSLVRKTIPDATESVQVGWSVVSYKYRTMCVLISPRDSVVRLMVDPRGEDLDDPAGLLVETGVRFMHVDFKSTGEINEQNLVPIILNAAQICGRTVT